MIYVAIGCMFILAVTTLFFMIKHSANKVVVFFLTPLLIASSILSYAALRALEGAPIKGYPEYPFAVLSAYVSKPDIIIVVQKSDTKDIKTYMIPFDQANANQMNREKNLTAAGVARKGSFEKNKFGEMRYIVELSEYTPPPKNVPPNQQTPSNTGGR